MARRDIPVPVARRSSIPRVKSATPRSPPGCVRIQRATASASSAPWTCGTMMPAAPRSSARPMRMRVPDSTRTSGVAPVPFVGHEHRHEVRLGGHPVLEVDEHPVEARPRADLRRCRANR